jgi:hypothetical protein
MYDALSDDERAEWERQADAENGAENGRESYQAEHIFRYAPLHAQIG